MNLAIYDDGLIDAAKNRATNPSMGLTALQVSGAMPCFLRMIVPENRYHFSGSCSKSRLTGIDEQCSRT
jgi:hypothetical protein